MIGGSADVVSGYFDHCVNLAAKGQQLEAFVVYDRYPGLVLVVSPAHKDEIKSIKDLAGKKVGVSAPGSSTDFFLKYLLKKNGVDPNSAAVIGVGLGATAVAAMEQGQIDAAVMLDPSVTLLQGKFKDLKILSDTRTQKDTQAVFGGDYPGGALYTKAEWIEKHPKEMQGLTNAIVNTLAWIHSHTAEEIMAKMPANLVGPDKAGYLEALKNTIPMYSTTGKMDPKGAAAVLAVFSLSSPEVAKAQYRREQDLHQQVRRGGRARRIEQDDLRRLRRIADLTANTAGNFPAVFVIVEPMNLLSDPIARRLRPCRQRRRGVPAAAHGRRSLAGAHRAVFQSHRLWRVARAGVRCRPDPRRGGWHRGSAACSANATACCRAIWAAADIGGAILDAVAAVKRANPAARYCCDPVIGDVGRGIFVREGIPEFMKAQAVPAADIITPNQFELDYLSGRGSATVAEARDALKAVHDLGPRVVLVTSLHTYETPDDAIDLLASDDKGVFRLRTPKLPLVGERRGRCHRGVVLCALSAQQRHRRRRWRRRPRAFSASCQDRRRRLA